MISCSEYDKLLKDGSAQARLDAANDYYNKGNYFKALQLYDLLIVELRGLPQFEMHIISIAGAITISNSI